MQAFVFLCFLFSGATGLVFENLWVRMLTLVFGSTSLAVSSVLTAYMGGLALGSWLFGRWADRLRDPLRAYAVIELAVGICALGVPLVVQGLYPSVNAWLWRTFEPGYFAFSFLRFFFSAILLIVPTTLMGGTLPVLTRVLVRTRGELGTVGSRVGWLYTMNTAGAVLGTFLCGFVLLPSIGLRLTNLGAAAVNVLVIGVGLLLLSPVISRSFQAARDLAGQVAGAMAGEGEEPRPPIPRAARIAVLVAFGLSGLAAMNAQVVWSRVLSMVIGSSVYAFALILMAFLLGIALGSTIASALLARRRRRNLVLWLAVVHLVIASTAITDYFFVDEYPYWFAGIITRFEHFYEHVGLIMTVMFAIAAIAILPVTVGMGATMPITAQILSPSEESVGRDIGRIYAVNTIGAIVGSFASAFILVPGLSRIGFGYGLQWSYLVSVVINMGLFVTLMLVSGLRRGFRVAALVPPLVLVVLVSWVVRTRSMWEPAKITIGAFRVSLADDVIDEETWGEPEIVYYFDGMSTTVSVEKWGQHIAMKNNGKVEASSGDDMITQIMVSAYPLLLHPRILDGDLRAAIVGFGSGVTVGAAMQFPVGSVDVVELEPAVVESSRSFERHNFLRYGASAWPYVLEEDLHVISNDGRNFLASGARKYDVVISEPSNPWITGVSNLFTEDHYRAATRSLAPGGMYCQWIQLYELSLPSIKALFRTFAAVFPHVVVFAADPLSSDTVMIGSFEPISIDLERIEKLWSDPRVRNAMGVAAVREPQEMIGRIIFASRSEVMKWTAGGRVNTDDNAFIEFSAPRDLIGYEKHERSAGELYAEDWKFGKLDGLLAGYGEGSEAGSRYAELALALASSGRYGMAGHMLTRSGSEGASEMGELAVLVLANLTSDENDPEVVFDPPVPGPSMDPATDSAFWKSYDGTLDLLIKGEVEKAFEKFYSIPEILRRNSGPSVLFLEAYVDYYNGRYDEAIELLDGIIARPDGYARTSPEVYYYLAKAYDRSYNYPSAVEQMKNYVLMKLAQKLREKSGKTEPGGEGGATPNGTEEEGAQGGDKGETEAEG